MQAVAVKLVGRDDKFHLAMGIKVRDDDVLIRRPRTAHHQGELGILDKLGHQRELTRCRAHIGHAVKACVAGNDHILDTNARQQFT